MRSGSAIPVALPAAIILLLSIAAASAGPPGRYEKYDRGVYLPYVNPPGPGEDITDLPRLRISFGGRSYGAVMDTGSTGIVVSADKIPNVTNLQSLGPGELTYSSSGRIMIGRWVVTPVTISGGDGTRIITAPIAVLAVTRVACTQGARRCSPNEAPRRISMLGVGFGRGGDQAGQSGLGKNPFLNVRNFNDTSMPAACGSLLMDTGVTAMYLTVPESQAPADARTVNGTRPTLVAGTTLTISIPADDPPQALYTFTVGDGFNPLAPSNINLVDRSRQPFVNTSVRFLNGFDYLYDADGGFVGLRWTGHAS